MSLGAMTEKRIIVIYAYLTLKHSSGLKLRDQEVPPHKAETGTLLPLSVSY